MKTIAEYQPHPLIREAINYAATQYRVLDDQVWLVAILVAKDAGEQEIFCPDELIAWTRQVIEQAHAEWQQKRDAPTP